MHVGYLDCMHVGVGGCSMMDCVHVGYLDCMHVGVGGCSMMDCMHAGVGGCSMMGCMHASCMPFSRAAPLVAVGVGPISKFRTDTLI